MATEHVGTTRIFDNDKIIVWNLALQPGGTTPMHTHHNAYICYALQGGPLDGEDEHGNDPGIFDVPTGAVFDVKRENGELEVVSEINKGVKFPVTHNAKHVGDTTHRAILIEFK